MNVANRSLDLTGSGVAEDGLTSALSLASLRWLAAHGTLPGSLDRAGGPAPPLQLAPLPLRLGHGRLVASVALLPSAYPARFASRQAYASARDVNNRYPAIALSTIASGSPCIAIGGKHRPL